MAAQLYWVNKSPFFVGSQSAASSGKVAMVRTTVSGSIGLSMQIKFVLATASEILAWIAIGSNVTTLLSKQVVFQFPNPITYRNMVVGDGNYDLTNFGPSTFDLWEGTINCIIVA